MKSPMHRTVSVLCSLAACALLSGCGGGKSGTDDTEIPRQATTASTAAPVVIHMTGLVLIVPPKQGQNEVKVLLPALNNPQHAARLGFGMVSSNPDAAILCVDPAMVANDEICYVDLTMWKWDEFGGGGTPVPANLELPRGVLNATHITGTLHKVPASTPTTPRAVFRAGWAGPTHCSLANWTYEPRGAQGQTLPAETQALVNVLDWEIENLTNPTLVFRRENPDTVITVPLLAPQNGRIALILANIPTTDYKDLPPGRPTGLGSVPARADHFEAYYNVLADQSQQPPEASRRPIPGTPKPITTRPCPVDITTTRLKALDEGNAAIATYACIVASAEGS